MSTDWSSRQSDEPTCRLWNPNELLQDWLAESPGLGAALDLGCGGGREAVFLAAQGWKVMAVDRLEENLHRGFLLADRYLKPEQGKLIAWKKEDVLGPAWRPIGPYDLILSFFLFDRRLLSAAAQWLAPGGTLLVEAFTPLRRAGRGKPSSPDRVLDSAETDSLLKELDLEKLHLDESSNGETLRLVARRSR
jgi:tellurite methyltransferase